jgi:hypothetical protein
MLNFKFIDQELRKAGKFSFTVSECFDFTAVLKMVEDEFALEIIICDPVRSFIEIRLQEAFKQ